MNDFVNRMKDYLDKGVEVSKDADFQSGMIFTTDKNELLVDNLLINQKYYWRLRFTKVQ